MVRSNRIKHGLPLMGKLAKMVMNYFAVVTLFGKIVKVRIRFCLHCKVDEKSEEEL